MRMLTAPSDLDYREQSHIDDPSEEREVSCALCGFYTCVCNDDFDEDDAADERYDFQREERE